MRFSSRILAILYAFLITACQSLPENFDASKLGTTERDVTYCVMDGVALKMDVYYPVTRQEKWPVIMHIHGGGFTTGSKGVSSIADAATLGKSGFLTVAVEYRLAPKYKFPAMIEDVKCAVRYLRAHAAEYNIDAERFGAIGGSAGGHLAALLGLTDSTAGFDVGEYLEYPSNVQAVVDMYGSSDVMPPYTTHLYFEPKVVFDITDVNDPIFVRASPVSYVSANSPPFLIIHGERDTTVPPLQSTLLYEKMKSAGAPVEIIMVKNAGHNLKHRGNKEGLNPPIEELQEDVLRFFSRYLK
jgi:acetyl esterase/lipase